MDSVQCGCIRCSDWGKQWNPKNSWYSNKTRAGCLSNRTVKCYTAANRRDSLCWSIIKQAASAPPPPPPPPPPPSRDIRNVRTEFAFFRCVVSSFPFMINATFGNHCNPNICYVGIIISELCLSISTIGTVSWLLLQPQHHVTKKKANLSLCPIIWPWRCIQVDGSKAAPVLMGALTFWHRSFTFNSNKSPTWINNFSVYYPDVCFGAFSRPLSGARWLQWQPLVLPSYRGDSRAVFVVGPADYHHDTKVKPEAATAVKELLIMGGKTPETCWAVNKRQDNKLINCCIRLVICLN